MSRLAPSIAPLALILPTTSNFSPGAAVPIPTLPSFFTYKEALVT